MVGGRVERKVSIFRAALVESAPNRGEGSNLISGTGRKKNRRGDLFCLASSTFRWETLRVTTVTETGQIRHSCFVIAGGLF